MLSLHKVDKHANSITRLPVTKPMLVYMKPSPCSSDECSRRLSTRGRHQANKSACGFLVPLINTLTTDPVCFATQIHLVNATSQQHGSIKTDLEYFGEAEAVLNEDSFLRDKNSDTQQ